MLALRRVLVALLFAADVAHCASPVRHDVLRTARGDNTPTPDVGHDTAIESTRDAGAPTSVIVPPTTLPGICAATFRAPFHLRATADAASRGRELPGGTRARVLAVTMLVRVRTNRLDSGESNAALTQVQIEGTGDVGYAFVRPVEFGAECPVLVDYGAVRSSPDAVDDHRYPSRDAAIRARHPRGRLDERATPEVGPLDVDGDGRRDAVVSVHSDGRGGEGSYPEDEFGLLRHDERGWQYSTVEPWSDRDCHESCMTRLLQTLRTPGRPFLLYRQCPCGGTPTGMCGYPAVPNLREPENSYRLHRWVGDGEARLVFSQPIDAIGEALEWTAESDGAIRVTGQRSRRSQRLVWDETRWVLVPDRPTIPVVPYEPTVCLDR